MQYITDKNGQTLKVKNVTETLLQVEILLNEESLKALMIKAETDYWQDIKQKLFQLNDDRQKPE